MSNKKMDKLIEEYQNDPYDFIEKSSVNDLVKLIEHTNYQYYNFDNPFITDEEYDLLKEELEKRDPNNKLLKQVADKVHSKDKIKLPVKMASMDKLKPSTDQISKWIQKYTGGYVISDKLDGSSGLLVFESNNINLYTRGDGTTGTDISSIVNSINGIPNLKKKDKVIVRGELLISKDNFKKYEESYSNSRAMVNGLIGKKKVSDSELKNINFVAYEVIEPSLKPSEQINFLKTNKFDLVTNKVIESISEEVLSSYFKERKKKSKYDIDGIIITDNKIYKRSDGNPKHSFAFKELLEDQIADTIITDVEWRVSKDGLIKPRVHVKPVKIGGITIKHVTGHNAKNIVDNGIGKGAKIKLTRAGEVIPYILKVLKKVKPAEPEISYKWNETKVDYILDKISEDSEYDMLVKNLTFFVKKMNIKNLDESLIKKMIDVDIDSVPKIINVTKTKLLEIEGFKDKMATKIHKNIKESIKDVELSQVMTASNLFGHGLGEKKLKKIIDNIPDILNVKLPKDEFIERIIEIDGFDTKTSTQFVKNLEKFKKFIKENKNIKYKIETKKGSKFEDLKIVFTGFRDKDLEKVINENGGNVTNTISSNTSYLIIKDKDSESKKIEDAKTKKVKILTIDEFKKLFKTS